jgi:hypothetical protein
MLLNDNISRRVNISGAIKRAAKRELSCAVGRSAQRGGLQLIYQLGLFQFSGGILLFFEKNANKKAL